MVTFWKDKQGNELTFKEFTTRWKEGINNITPIQKLKTQVRGTQIILLGIIIGLIISIYHYKNLWWVAIILFGSLLTTGVQYLGLKQQYNILKEIEEQLE